MEDDHRDLGGLPSLGEQLPLILVYAFPMISLAFFATVLPLLALATLAQLGRVRMHPAKDEAVGASSLSSCTFA